MGDGVKDEAALRVVAAFIAPQDSIWQGAIVNVCEDGSWWAKRASDVDSPWERQSPPLAPLVTDDQRASVSGGRNADTGQEQRDPVACEVGLKPSGLSGSAPAETQVRPESDTTTPEASVSGERDGERCERCGWERDHDPCCPSPDNVPTDRNAGREAALAHRLVTIARRSRERMLYPDETEVLYAAAAAVEAALKGGKE